jgi:hypothetical protein
LTLFYKTSTSKPIHHILNHCVPYFWRKWTFLVPALMTGHQHLSMEAS